MVSDATLIYSKIDGTDQMIADYSPHELTKLPGKTPTFLPYHC